MNWLNFKWMTINIKWVINDAKKYNHRSLLRDKSVPTKVHNAEITNPSISECDLIWRQDLYKVIKLKWGY